MFEIRFALLGHVSVGKTTVLKALFQEQFGEVSMKRTTGGINHFRISSTTNRTKRAKRRSQADKDGIVELDGSMSGNSDKSCVTAKQTLADIIEDNEVLRHTKTIQERTFDVELDEPLVKMREDTHLVVIDIPGINEAQSHQLYLDYVKASWDEFDCVIFVIDANSGANTEEQVNLLHLVKQYTTDIKDVPVIVLCNKVDHPNNEEVMGLVAEVRQEVERIFKVDDRERALEQALAGERFHGLQQASPCFIPVSAENAFLYRLVSQVHFGDYKRLDKAYLEKIGHKEYGENMWPELSEKEKHELVFKAVNDSKNYKGRIDKSNFDKFMKVLDFFIGGDLKQEAIIEKQLSVALRKLSAGDDIVDNLSKIYDRGTALGKPTDHLKDRFWDLYAKSKEQAFKKLNEDVNEISSLHAPMDELVQYASTLHHKIHTASTAMATKEDDYAKIILEMKALIRRQCRLVLEKEANWTPVDPDPPEIDQQYPQNWVWQGNGWYNNYSGCNCSNPQDQHPTDNVPHSWQWNAATKKWRNQYTGAERSGSQDINPSTRHSPKAFNWESLSPHAWHTIISSMVLLSGRDYYLEHFGKEMADLGWLSRTGKFAYLDHHCFTCKQSRCGCVKVGLKYLQYMEGSYTSGVFVPKNKAKYDWAMQLVAPDSLSNPAHWGHLGWMFCKFIKSQE